MDVEKLELLYTECKNNAAAVENSMEIPQKIKIEPPKYI